MKPRHGHTHLLAATLGALILGVGMARATDPTALELVKEGNRFLGEQSKDKLLGIRSEKSLAGLTPNIWYVSYYDPDVTSRRVEIKFGVGRQMGLARSWRPFGGGGSVEKIMDLTKLKVDSDKVIKTAIAEPLLAKFTIKATQVWLEHGAGGPVWRVRLWVSKLSKPDQAVSVGELYISPETGEVTKSGLDIKDAA
jgi:hypothetical protein